MAGTMCRRRLALFLVFYLVVDFADPLVHGTVRVEVDESAEAVEAEAPPAGDSRLQPAAAVRVPFSPVPIARSRDPRVRIEEREAPQPVPLGRPQPRSPTTVSSALVC
jgi:hypothetical protein